jgi:uncharacterized protein DUF3305
VTAELASIPIGVIVERRKSSSPWIDFVWRPVAVLSGEPDTPPWSPLSNDGDKTTFYAGGAEIKLYRTETTNYRDNLTAEAGLWVVLRPTGGEPPYALFTVTADPAEGEAFTEAGTDLVEQVPMPQSVRDIVAAFVAEHHVERVFYKQTRGERDAVARRMQKGTGRDDE